MDLYLEKSLEPDVECLAGCVNDAVVYSFHKFADLVCFLFSTPFWQSLIDGNL
jgi:hypothetical protein